MASLAGTSSDDFLIATATGTEYRGGAGNDTYIFTPLIPANAVITIVDTEGANKIQLAEGLTIASSSFFDNAAQLTLSNGAVLKILGAKTFTFDIGANAVAGDSTVAPGTTAGATYAQFAASLGVATLPAAGVTTPVAGTANFSTTTGSAGGAATYALTAAATSANEGTKATFNLVTTNVTAGTDVAYTISGIDAADLASGALTGKATVGTDGKATISVDLKADATTEGAETLKVALDGKTVSATTTVNDTSLTPGYSVKGDATSVIEGKAITFTVETTTAPTADLTLKFALAGDTSGATGQAIVADDVSPSSGTVTIKANTTSAQVTVNAKDDGVAEFTEGAKFLVLDATTNATVASTAFLVQDGPTYKMGADASVDEGSAAVFTLTTTNLGGGTTVPYTVSGTATAADVDGGKLASGNFTLAADGTASVSYTTLKDLLTEGDETIIVTAGGKSQTITIKDTSPTPVYTVTPGADINEGDTASFTITADSKVDTTLAYTVTGADAKDVSSTTVLKGNVTLTAGTGTVKLDSLKDATTEGSETWTLTLDATSKAGSLKVADISVTPVLTGDNVTGTAVSGQGTAIIKQSTLLSNDIDSTGKATLTGAVTVVAGSASKGQTFNSSNGDIVFVADAGQRQGTFKYSVAGADNATPGVVNVNINSAPAIAATTALSTKQDTAVTGTVTATDADSDAMAFTYKADNGTVVAGTAGAYTYTPKAGFTGTDTITVTVTDNFTVPLASTATIPVTVTATPKFTVTGATAVTEGNTASFDVTLTSPVTATAYAVTVALAATGGATAGTDFTNALTLDSTSSAAGVTYASGLLTFPANATVTKATLTTAVAADASSPEPGEGLSVTLSAPTNSAILGSTSAVTTAITDTPLTFTLTASATDVYEGAPIVYTLQAYNGVNKVNLDADRSFDFQVVPGSSTATNDQGTNLTNLNDFASSTFNPSKQTITKGTGSIAYTVVSSTDSLTELVETYTVKVFDAGTTTEAATAVTTKLLDGTSAGGGQKFTLTSGIDTLIGASGDDTYTASSGTLTALDSLDGGDGTDVLNYSDTAAINVPASATVKNIETANITGALGVVADASGWTGLTKLTATGFGTVTVSGTAAAAITVTDSTQAASSVTVNGGSTVAITSTGATTGTVTVGNTAAPTGAVTVARTTSAAGSNAGAINVTGGSTVTITQTNGNAVNTDDKNGAVTVTGSANTTSVSVIAPKAATKSASVAGVAANTVAITDVNTASTTKAGTITSVTANSFTSLGVGGNALTTLNVANGSGNIIIDNSGLTTPTNKTLAVTIDGQTTGTLDDADIYTTLNITTANNASTLSNVTFGATTALTVAGTKGLTLTSAAGLSALKTVTVTGSAGITADLSAGTVTAVDTSGTTGASTVTVDASKATFAGGAGVDKVTLSATTPSKTISLGGGDDTLDMTAAAGTPTAAIGGGAGTDTVAMTAALAATASASSTFAGIVTGFESLTLTAATNQTIDLAVLGNFSKVSTSGGNGLTLNNLPSGGTLVLTGAGTAYTVANTAFTSGTADVVNLSLTDGTGAAVNFASTGITASDVETFAITTADTQATPTGTFNDMVTLLGNSVKTITVAGNAGLTLTAASTALTTVDASGIAATGITPGFTWTSGALAAANVVKGSATGTNTVDMTASVAAATNYTGGTGIDTVTITNSKANVINLGGGTTANTVGGSATGNNTITSTSTGADTVTVGSGNNVVSLGDGDNNFTATTGNNTYTGGSGVDTVVVTTGGNTISVGGGNDSVSIGASTQLNTVNVGTGTDTVILTGTQAAAGYYTTITGMGAGDVINLDGVSLGATTAGALGAKITLGGAASFANYLDAAAATATGATNAVLKWFQFDGNTFLVSDNSNNVTFADGVDTVVSLVGLVDLSTSTTTTAHIVTLV